jgi:hypothetical protein
VIASAGIAVEVSYLDKSKETKLCLANVSEMRRMAYYQFAVSTVSE